MKGADCQVGLICALPAEFQAVLAIFDPTPRRIDAGRDRTIFYHIGSIGKHRAVAACLPCGRTGSIEAAHLASCMNDAFPSLKYRFMVGVAGGNPQTGYDIRLGDVVIATSIIQSDFGKALPNGNFQQTRELFHVPSFIRNVLSELKCDEDRTRRRIDEAMSMMKRSRPKQQEEWTHPGQDQDQLFKADYNHIEQPDNPRCEICDLKMRIPRQLRDDVMPRVFEGLIASANSVIRDSFSRDRLKSDRVKPLAVEMEAAGLEHCEFGVIRGICDYADSHKNKQWQAYASATAAAATKVLLDLLPSLASSPASETYPNGDNHMQLRQAGRRATDLPDHPSSTMRATAILPEDQQSSYAESESPNALGSDHRAYTFPRKGIITQQESFFDHGGNEVPNLQAVLNSTGNKSSEPKSRTKSDSTMSLLSPLNPQEIKVSAHEVQLFSRLFVEYSVTFLDRKSEHEPGKPLVIQNHKSKLLLLQVVGDKYFKISRKIELQSPEHEIISLWLPFDRLSISVQGRATRLKFSDCNAKQSRTMDGRAKYSCKFDSAHPNMRVSLKFPTDLDARQFADQILCVNCGIDYYNSIDLSLRPARSSKFNLYECFEDREKTRRTPNILALTRSVKDGGYKILEAFFFGTDLDFKLAHEERKVEFRSLQEIQYSSPTDTMPYWPLPWVENNPEGKPESTTLETVSAVNVSFETVSAGKVSFDEDLYQDFMSAITGWQLRFTGDTKCRSCKRDKKYPRGTYHKGQVTLWSKSSGSGSTECCITLNLCDAQRTGIKWKSFYLKAPGKAIGTLCSSFEHRRKDATVVLDNVHESQGTHIVRDTMSAGSPIARDPRQPLLRQEFKFSNEVLSQQFADALRQVWKP